MFITETLISNFYEEQNNTNFNFIISINEVYIRTTETPFGPTTFLNSQQLRFSQHY